MTTPLIFVGALIRILTMNFASQQAFGATLFATVMGFMVVYIMGGFAGLGLWSQSCRSEHESDLVQMQYFSTTAGIKLRETRKAYVDAGITYTFGGDVLISVLVVVPIILGILVL